MKLRMNKRSLYFAIAGFILIITLGLWNLSNSRSFQIAGELITDFQLADSLIAVTFDDGPSGKYTDEILSVLNHYNVKATFFVTGREVEEFPNEARKIVEAGHQLGNHSYSHKKMIFKSGSFIENELDLTDQAIMDTGYKGKVYFRPPYCKKLILLPLILKGRNQVSIAWDIEPESYAEVRSSAKNIASHISERVHPGSIILLHVMYNQREESRKSLPIFIEELLNQGYRFVTIDELVRQGKKSYITNH